MAPIIGEIRPDHMPKNKWLLQFAGVIPITAVTATIPETELETTQLPDRKKATGGKLVTGDIVITVPMHHLEEQAALEAWLLEAEFGVPTYKKVGTLVYQSASGITLRTYTCVGCFVKKRKPDDLDKNDQGDMATATWTLSVDRMLPV